MATKFLVVQTSYDYNDEHYVSSDDEAYTISSNLYASREQAQAEADRLNETQGFHGTTGDDDDEDNYIEPFYVEEVEEEDQV